jgi:hypothetical protein
MDWLFHAATMMSTDGAVGTGVCTPFGCVSGALLAKGLLVLGLGALSFFALAALSFIPEARAVVREERSRADAERTAFERFARRVAQLEAGAVQSPSASMGPSGPGPGGSGPGPGLGLGTLSVSGGDDDRLERVQRAYRETVMAVDHYEEEYGEPPAMNLAAEFGEGVAAAVTGADVFTPTLQETLVESAEAARERRQGLVRALDCEEESLREAASTLRCAESTADEATSGPTIDLSFEELMDRWGRLYDAQQRCEELLDAHQDELHERYGVAPRLDGPVSLHEYLYSDQPYTHPILAEGTRVLDRLGVAQSRTSTALSRRV